MKKINITKSLLTVAMLGSACIANAQNQPLSFGAIAPFPANWYLDYVGTSLAVTTPASVVGDKQFTTTNDGTGATGSWGAPVTTIINADIVIAASDSSGNSGALQNGTGSYPSMQSSIGLIYRGLNEFGAKALLVENAGALACIIVNNVPGSPVGMAAGASGGSVNIPVFMISEADGDAIRLAIEAGHTVSMSITPWGQGHNDDLGILSDGVSIAHAYAIPTNQLTAGNGNPVPYKNLDGAFIANFGTNNETNVKLSTTVQFTPAGGEGSSIVHQDSLTVASFPAHDSIITMYNNSDYDLHPTSNGRYDFTYNLSSDATDEYLGDNTLTYSLYATNNLFSKGRYDFTNNVPYEGTYESAAGGAEFTWGPLYYVANGGSYVDSLQVSIASPANNGVSSPITGQILSVFIFQWTDGLVATDSLIQGGELNPVGFATRTFGGTDSSDEVFTIPVTDGSGAAGTTMKLDSNSWYWFAVDVPAGDFLGCDGITDYYPRSYGRANNGSGYLEMSSTLLLDAGGNVSTYANQTFPPYTFGGSSQTDSVVFSTQKGLIPSVPFTISQYPSAVKNVSHPSANVDIFPNPAVDYFTVTVGLDHVAKTVTYSLYDAVARIVTRQTSSNVQTDNVTFSTENLAAGTYYLTVIADGKATSFNKVTVIK